MSPADRISVGLSLVQTFTGAFGHDDGTLMFTVDELTEWVASTQSRINAAVTGLQLDLKDLLLWLLSIEAMEAVDGWVSERGFDAYRDVQWMQASIRVLARALMWELPVSSNFEIVAARVRQLDAGDCEEGVLSTHLDQRLH